MFLLSFILGDWAIHELVHNIRDRRWAITLVASSYVTWTYQTHTFSNSIETLVVLWVLVLVGKLKDDTEHVLSYPCGVLAFLGVLGVWNRITFPGFVLAPLIQILPGLYHQPLRVPIMLIAGLITLTIAVTMDTEFYTGARPHFTELLSTSVITPWNNVMYNIDTTNLAEHGLHPFWQHVAANLPQLLGPAFLLVFLSSRKDMLFWAALSGILVLSCFPHQEARFLLPAVPLLLSTVKIPRRGMRPWLGAWALFNILAAVLFGVYHQGGAVPAQTFIAGRDNISQAFWWKTYSPPRWLLNGKNEQVTTTDLMGMPGDEMMKVLSQSAGCVREGDQTLLVAPSSATYLDQYVVDQPAGAELEFERLWEHRRHIGLDDMDFGDDGVWPTLQRVIGRRGLTVWLVSREC
jgi:hypothetical protein